MHQHILYDHTVRRLVIGWDEKTERQRTFRLDVWQLRQD